MNSMLSAESGDFVLPQLLGVRRIGDQIYIYVHQTYKVLDS